MVKKIRKLSIIYDLFFIAIVEWWKIVWQMYQCIINMKMHAKIYKVFNKNVIITKYVKCACFILKNQFCIKLVENWRHFLQKWWTVYKIKLFLIYKAVISMFHSRESITPRLLDGIQPHT